MRNGKVLVTGGLGFLGSHLVDLLLKTGYETIVFDNFSFGKLDNLKQHIEKQGFQLIKGDVRNQREVEKAVKNVDFVCHLAAVVNIPLSIENPLLANAVNVEGTLTLLKECVKRNVKRFVYASTCAVYGEAQYLPIDEEHPTNPLSPYGASKLAAEYYCKVFYQVYGLPTVCLRFFNVYGSRQTSGPYGGVITTFIESLRRGKALTIFGNGNQTRDFIYVEDATKAYEKALYNKECLGGTFNIGTGTKTSINELAQVLIKLFGKSETKIVYSEKRKGDIKESCANIGKAQKFLKFKPEFSVYEGLKKLVKGTV